MQGARTCVKETMYALANKKADMATIRNQIRDDLKEFIWKQTKRNPMIFPILMEL